MAFAVPRAVCEPQQRRASMSVTSWHRLCNGAAGESTGRRAVAKERTSVMNDARNCGARMTILRSISSALPWLGLIALLLALVACGPLPTAPTAAHPAAPVAQPVSTPVAATKVYAAIGASDAFGIGTDDPARQAWPVVLDRTLGPSYRLIDLGIPGATVDLATRDELPVALDAQPQIVTVWLAVNDFDAGIPRATYTQQLRALLHTLATGTAARVYVGNLPDLSFIPYFAGRDIPDLQAQIAEWNAAIAQDCLAEGATLVDLYSGWTELASHPEYISSDGFHPSSIGAARLAGIFASMILPDLASATSPRAQQQPTTQAGAS